MNPFQKRMDAAFQKMTAIRKKAEEEKRSLAAEELEERAALKAEIEQAKREMDDFNAEEELRADLYGTGGTALTIEGEGQIAIPDQPIYRGSPSSMLGQQLLDIRMMSKPDIFDGNEVRSARSRLEQTAKRNIEKMTEKAKAEGRAAATGGMTVGVPSDGGMFLQGETAIELMTNGFNNSEILPRTASRTLGAGSQFVEIDGIDEISRVNGSRGGGIRVYTNKELGELTGSKTQFKKIRIEPTKLTGLYNASGEMMRNVTFLGQEMRQLFGEEFAFKCQDLAYRGSGAGEALGILNSGCLVTVPKETGQAARTIVTKNLSKMWARFRGKNPVWLINQDVNPELDELTIPAGTGAVEPRFVTYGPDGLLRIKGAPVIPIEQAETLGTVGDITLCDWSQYITANKGDIMEAMSIHVNFLYDQETYRFIYYFDGQPRWTSPLTPFKGVNTVSPFITLAARA